MSWHFMDIDLGKEDSFFIRTAHRSDVSNILALRQGTYGHPLAQLSDDVPSAEVMLEIIKEAEKDDNHELFLLAVRSNDAQAISSFNGQANPRAAGPGYCASHHWVEGREQAPLSIPYAPPNGTTSNGPIMGFIRLRPFLGERITYRQAAQLYLVTVEEAGLGAQMRNSVIRALVEQVAVRISQRNNLFSSLIIEFPYRPRHPDAEEMLRQWLSCGFKQVGLLERITERDGFPLDLMICQRHLNRTGTGHA